MTGKERSIRATARDAFVAIREQHGTAIDLDDSTNDVAQQIDPADYQALAWFALRAIGASEFRASGLNGVVRLDADGNRATVYYAFDEPDQLRLLSVSELRTKAEYEMRQGQARYLNGKAWDRIVKVAEARGASDDDAIGTVLSEDEVADLVDRGYIDAQAAS